MQISAANPPGKPTQTAGNVLLCLLCLALVLLIPFYRSLESSQVLFANDGPLGAARSAQWALPEGFKGVWLDSNWLGQNAGSYLFNLTSVFLAAVGPVANAKFSVPLVLLLTGFSAALFFRTLGARWTICTLGGLAAMLNSNFFSNAAWGLATRGTMLTANLLALAVLNGFKDRPLWIRLPLAGLLVGQGVVEGADNGAIFSLYFAAYVMFHAWQEIDGTAVKKLALGGLRVAVVAGFAGFMAYQTIISLIGTQVTGVAGMNQKPETREERWNWATQWSLPKAELLRVVVPGLYGYRLDTEEGGNYWGTVGRQPGWETHHQGFPRHSGAGEYAGVLVVFIGAWAVVLAFRKQEKTFTLVERRFIWFWFGALIVSAMFATGRHAPFYQFIFPLPFFSSIRNPMKFMHPGHLALMILFGYGLIGLYRRHIENAAASSNGLMEHLKSWWGKAMGFDRTWSRLSPVLVGLAALACLLYASSRAGLQSHLQNEGFDAATAKAISGFTAKEAAWSVFFLALSAGAVVAIMSNWFAGARLRMAGLLLGLILVADLSRANQPWVKYLNADYKYATNPVIDVLREKPYEHRVQLLPVQVIQDQIRVAQRQLPPDQLNILVQQFGLLQQVYGVEWTQHLFLNENIQCLDVIQMPRVAEEYKKYYESVGMVPFRNWQLTNTRLLLTLSPLVPLLNQQMDPAKQRFKTVAAFNFMPKPGVTNATLEDLTTVITNNGSYALVEFTGALPRVKLFNQWQPAMNDASTLSALVSPQFDPMASVLVADAINPPTPESSAAPEAGAAEITGYQPKNIRVKVDAKAPGVLLLNDKFDADWKVFVDGKPEKLLRCNFIMRGVQVPAGAHEVVFKFQPKLPGMVASLGGWVACFLLLGVLLVYRGKGPAPAAPTPAPASAAPPAKPAKRP